MNAADISDRLKRYLSEPNRIVIQNIVLLKSPWECDMIKVTKAGFFTEYEIKVSRADFKKDFNKRRRVHFPPEAGSAKWRSEERLKHEDYASTAEISKGVPKPKFFYFVTPKGLVKLDEVPEHAGLMEFGETGWPEIVKKAPQLKKPTKLSHGQIWNIAVKAASPWKKNDRSRMKRLVEVALKAADKSPQDYDTLHSSLQEIGAILIGEKSDE